MSYPVEAKVKAATTGAGIGVALAELAIWGIDTWLWTPDVTGDVPAPVQAAIVAAVAAGLAWLAGYRAKHTARPGDTPPAEKRRYEPAP